MMTNFETGKTVGYGLGMLALGIYFGNQFTGRLAYQPDVVRSPSGSIISVSEAPEWVGTVQTANNIVLVTFGLCMIGMLVCHHYSTVE